MLLLLLVRLWCPMYACVCMRMSVCRVPVGRIGEAGCFSSYQCAGGALCPLVAVFVPLGTPFPAGTTSV